MLSAQTITIHDITTLEPVENVGVYNNRKSFSALSDIHGKISVSGLQPSDTLYFQHPSYYDEALVLKNITENNHKVFLVEKIVELQEFIISARKAKEESAEVPQKVEVVGRKEIAFTNSSTTADMLTEAANVYVQKSQMGGGSPVLRGFEANKILLVLDGVRMNNAIYRSGHLQNVITLDQAAMERVEVAFGPGSVIYGSDALGGVLHFFTKSPQLSDGDTLLLKTNFHTKYATATEEKTGHIDVNFGYKKMAFLTGVTFSDFGDLMAGSNRSGQYPDWGKRHYYVESYGSTDSMVRNENPNLQKFTGYNQLNLLHKMLFQPSEKLNFTYNLQYSTSSNVPRYDKLTEYEGDTLKYAEWHYGPQNYLFNALNFYWEGEKNWADNVQITLAYQKVEEDRIWRQFGETERTNRQEDVHIYTANIDFEKQLQSADSAKTAHFLSYGTEAIFNRVNSDAFVENILTGTKIPAQSRYPSGGSFTQSYAAYLMHKWVWHKSTFTSGVRYSHFNLFSSFTGSEFDFPFEEATINTGAFNGSLGWAWRPRKSWQFNIIGSSAFRAPNVDDYGKVRAKNNRITIPNPELEPEYAYSAEAGIKKIFNKRAEIQGNIYITYLTNAIVRADHQFNGADSLLYQGDMYRVQANVNAREALLHGFSFNARAEVSEHFSVEGDVSYTKGRILVRNEPLAHIPPVHGSGAIHFKKKKLHMALVGRYNGWKRAFDYALTGEDNFEQATEDGTPPWWILNWRVSYQINEFLQVQSAVENIFDTHYRPFASGISAPGRNFILALRAKL